MHLDRIDFFDINKIWCKYKADSILSIILYGYLQQADGIELFFYNLIKRCMVVHRLREKRQREIAAVYEPHNYNQVPLPFFYLHAACLQVLYYDM